MYLRRCCRKKGGEEYESYTLVESVRTAKGPRQRTAAAIGKLPGFDKEERIGWEEIGRILVCREHIPSGREDVSWSIMACILVLARFCTPSSELQIAESWYEKTALSDLLGVSENKITMTVYIVH